MHPDSNTYKLETEYFFIGDGRLTCAIQWSKNHEMSPYGLILQDPEKRARKESSLLFHPEYGLTKTTIFVIANGKRYTPDHNNTKVEWGNGDKACVIVSWGNNEMNVEEKFMVCNSSLFRQIKVKFKKPVEYKVVVSLYANPALFNDFSSKDNNCLKATGYANITLKSIGVSNTFERFITINKPDYKLKEEDIVLIYSLNDYRLIGIESKKFENVNQNLYLNQSLGLKVSHLYNVAKIGLRAVVSKTGSFDASVWQYGMQWGLDSAFVTKAAILSGDRSLAQELLTNIFSKIVSDKGEVMESNRFRNGLESELNGNGALLCTIKSYLDYSNDEDFIKSYWLKIKLLADYILKPEFNHKSGLLLSVRDFWERLGWMGVIKGFELGHQVLCAYGLQFASIIANQLSNKIESNLWKKSSNNIIYATLKHKKYSLLEKKKFIHRRLIDESIQDYMVNNSDFQSEDYEVYYKGLDFKNNLKKSEPDVTSILPIIYGMVENNSIEAIETMSSIEELWDTNGLGGYARCPNDSDQDSPGAWTFGNCFALQAQLIMEDYLKSERTLKWLIEKAGSGGSWHEFYGERNSEGLPPNGIIVWGWAQWIILVIENLCGLKFTDNELKIAPVLSNLNIITKVGDYSLNIITTESNVSLSTHKRFSNVKINGVNQFVISVFSLKLPLKENYVLEFY